MAKAKQPLDVDRQRAAGGQANHDAVDFTGVPERERFAVWDDFLTRNISRHARHPVGDDVFKGEMTKDAAGFLNKFSVRSSPYTSAVTREVLSSGRHHQSYILIIPKRSEFVVHQDGFDSRLDNERMALLDSGLTGSITGIGFSAQTMVALPKKEWENRAPLPILESNFTIDASRVSARLARAYIEELEANGSAMSSTESALLCGHLLQLLSLYFENTAESIPGTINKDVRIRRIKSFVRMSMGNPKLSPLHVADHFGISVRYIARLFSEVDLTLMDYIWEARLLGAAHALAASSGGRTSIKDVAHRFGFNNQAHFATRFSARFGVSPSQYRRSAFPDESVR